MSVRLKALFFAMALLLPSYAGGQPPKRRGRHRVVHPRPIAFKAEPSMKEQLVRTGGSSCCLPRACFRAPMATVTFNSNGWPVRGAVSKWWRRFRWHPRQGCS